MQTCHFNRACRVIGAALVLGTTVRPGPAVTVRAEATVRGGASAAQDQDEAAAGYVHVKYQADLDYVRKAYFQFDLAGVELPAGAAGRFQVVCAAANAQNLQLWVLNQAYDDFAETVTWNAAQANDKAGNGMLTAGAASASKRGGPVYIQPAAVGAAYAFTVPDLAACVHDQRVTLVLAGVTHASNNAGGARFRRGQATLEVAPPVHRDVYILAGQSNMDGRGYTSGLTGALAGWAASQPDVPIRYRNPAGAGYAAGWQALAPGCSVPPGFSGALPSDRFGPELGFATEMQRLEPGRPLALIKVSQGATSLNTDWNPATAYLYAELTNTVRQALADLTAAGDRYTVQGFLWHQGESDQSEPHASQYAANFSNLLARLRTDLGLPALRVAVGDLASNKSAVVRSALRGLGADALIGFAGTDGFATVDGTHFDTPGVIGLGQRYARAMYDVDEDGCGDLWELAQFGSLTVAQGDATDFDRDGATDRVEDAAGTDPRDPHSLLRVQAAPPAADSGGGIALAWPSVEGRNYRVWRRADLRAGDWQALTGALPPTAPTNTFADPAPPATGAVYRVSVRGAGQTE